MRNLRQLVVMTPAHNEASVLPITIASVIAQTVKPDRWVIVDDASTDNTGDIARAAAASHPFISVTRRESHDGVNYGRKANAINAAWQSLAHDDVAFVVCLDADGRLPDTVFERAIEAFDADPKLGLTGCRYMQTVNGRKEFDLGPPHQVPGQVQVFRREVWDAIGGYFASPRGGLDSNANVAVRAAGWTTRVLPDLVAEHLRPEGSRSWGGAARANRGRGIRDYDAGNLAMFEIAKCARRLTDPPVVLGTSIRLLSYFEARIRRLPRHTPAHLVAQVRLEQRERIRQAIRARRIR